VLRIEISEGDGDGSSISIHGVNLPEPPDDDSFPEWDRKWTSICNGVHALLGELGPIPENGWKVKFWV